MSTTAPMGTAIRTGSGTLASLPSSNIGIGVRLVVVVGSLGKMVTRTSIGEGSKDGATLGVSVRA